MRIAIISDIHGNLPALNAAIEKLDELSPDYLVCLGDLVGYYPWPVECIKLVRKSCNIVLLGNHDEIVVSADFEKKINWFNEIAEAALRWCRATLLQPQFSKEVDFLQNLPILEDPTVEGIHMVLAHGSPDDPWEYIIYYPNNPDHRLETRMKKWLRRYKADIVAIGHTHVPFIFRKKGAFVINPGSIGQPRDGNPAASFAIANIAPNSLSIDLHRVPYDVEETCRRIQDEQLPDFLCQRLYRGI